MTLKKFTFFITVCNFLLNGAYSERLQGQIYSSIEGSAACFRRLNATHQAGCSSSLNGAVGVVHIIRDISDAQWIVQNSTAGPYIPVISTSVFNSVIELLLVETSNVAGVLVYDNSTMRPSSFSQQSKCPNEYYSTSESKCPSSNAGGIAWNEVGTGLHRRDIPYPIFYVPAAKIDVIDKIEQCFVRFNLDLNNQNGNPLCSIQLNSFMYAAVNTVTCLRRSASSDFLSATKVCDPLGDFNVYTSLFPLSPGAKAKEKPVILVTARIDTSSLFDGVAPGAASSVMGMVGVIATASLLAKMLPVNVSDLYDTNVLFTLLNGEAYDYIGSQRIAYDISQATWPPLQPLTADNIPLHVEVGQIGGALRTSTNSSWPMYAFVPKYEGTPSEITEFLAQFSNYTNAFNMGVTPKFTTDIPPSSIHSFRRILKNVTESGKLAEVLLADFSDTFSNKYYESILDDETSIGYTYHNISVSKDGTFISTDALLANGTMKDSEPQVKLARLSTALARALYQRVTGEYYDGNLSASAHMVDEVLYCFLSSQACRVLAAADFAEASGEAPDTGAHLYVGVAAADSPAALYALHALALLSGQPVSSANKTQCDRLDQTGHQYYWLKGWNSSGICMRTTANVSSAVSPAFIISDYDMSSRLYSTWTESVWQTMSARVFVAAGGGGARWAGALGAVATLLAGLVTRRLQRDPALFDAPAQRPATTGILGTANC